MPKIEVELTDALFADIHLYVEDYHKECCGSVETFIVKNTGRHVFNGKKNREAQHVTSKEEFNALKGTCEQRYIDYGLKAIDDAETKRKNGGGTDTETV